MRGWFRLFAPAVLLMALGNILFIKFELYSSLVEFPAVGAWKTSHFLFSYQDLGFVKRGLIGAPLDIDNYASSPAAVLLFSSAAALAFAALGAAAALRAPSSAARAFIVLSPAVFLQAGYDFGRFDTVNCVLALMILLSERRWAVLLAPVTVLVHETALFTVLPLVVAVDALRFGIRRELVVCCAASLALLAGTLLFGRYESSVPLAEIYPNQASLSLEVLTSSTADSVAFALDKFSRVGQVFWAMFAAILLHYACILLHIGVAFGGSRLCVAAAVSLPPLCLMVIGTDWARWVALCTVNALLFHLFTRDSTPIRAARERYLLERCRPVVLGAAVLAAVGGPMGINTPLPVVTHFVWRLVDLTRAPHEGNAAGDLVAPPETTTRPRRPRPRRHRPLPVGDAGVRREAGIRRVGKAAT